MRPSDDALAPLGPEPVVPPSGASPGQRPDYRPLRPWQVIAGALLAGATLFAACQGDNIWTGNPDSLKPKIVGIAAPAQVWARDTLPVQVTAAGVRQIESIHLHLSGALSVDTVLTVTPAATISATLALRLPDSLRTDTLFVTASATDKTGAVSPSRADTILTFARPDSTPPTVAATLSGPSTIAAGTQLRVRVVASDNVGLRLMGARLQTSASVADTLVSSTIAVSGLTRDSILTLPAIPPGGARTLYLVGFARDSSGNLRETTPAPVTVRDLVFDTVKVRAPTRLSTVPTGDSLLVQVYLRDFSKLKSLAITGEALRAAPNQTPQVVARYFPVSVTFPLAPAVTLPESALITRYLKATPDSTPGDSVAIVAVATDSVGNVGRDTAWIYVGGPTVRFVAPPTAPRAGDTIQMHTVAFDSTRTLDNVTLTVSGVGEPVTRTLYSATPTGSKLYDTTVPYAVTPSSLGPLVFTLSASSHVGTTVLTAHTVDTVRVSTKLSITRPVPLQAVALRDSLPVTVTLGSLQGVKDLAITGVAIRGDPTSTNPTVVTRYSPATVTFPLPPAIGLPDTILTLTRVLAATSDTTPEFVHIIATMHDSIGRTLTDTVIIQVGGPVIRFNLPPDGQQVAMGQVMPVEIVAQDQTYGLQSVVLTANGTTVRTWPAGGSKSLLTFDTTVVAPSTVGPLALVARAISQNSQFTASATSTLQVVPNPTGDTLAPRVRIANVILPSTGRLELHDSVGVQVVAADTGGAGLRTMGIYVTLDSLGTAVDSLHASLPARAGGDTLTFFFRPDGFAHYGNPQKIAYPSNVNFRVQAFALDTARNCGATTDNTWQRLPCQRLGVAPGDTIYRAGSDVGLPEQMILVAGRTVVLQPQSVIADVEADTVRGMLYVANMPLNQVDRLALPADTLLSSPIVAGSQPWGLDLFRDDTLIVANSGGTNISRITWSGSVPSETDRLLTPNLVLQEWQRVRDQTTGSIKWVISAPLDFSDRPQYIAQDSKYRVIYSTVPTSSSTPGTLRAAERQAGWKNTETWLLNREYAFDMDTARFVFENVDNISVAGPSYPYGGGLTLTYHQPGDSTIVYTLTATADSLCAPKQPDGSYVPQSLALERSLGRTIAFCSAGAWNLNKIGLSDTTFVAIARDRSHVSFGEGNTAGTGRVFMWNSLTDVMSPDQQVTDLVNNASEHVYGLALDMQGKLGVARGIYGSYFYDPNLRLQGIYGETNLTTSGVAMHPHHFDPYATNDSTLAFLGSHDSNGRPVIKIVDTYTFRDRGMIYLREDIAGLLKSSMPMAGDPASCKNIPGDPNCVVLKLYGVIAQWTDLQARQHARLVIIDVRRSDILP